MGRSMRRLLARSNKKAKRTMTFYRKNRKNVIDLTIDDEDGEEEIISRSNGGEAPARKRGGSSCTRTEHRAARPPPPRPPVPKVRSPIGAEISADYVDLMDDGDGGGGCDKLAHKNADRDLPFELPTTGDRSGTNKRRYHQKQQHQTHPLKVLQASKKRKMEKKLAAAATAAAAAAAAAELEKAASEKQRKENEKLAASSIPNFIIIDSDSSEDEGETEQKSDSAVHAAGNKTTGVNNVDATATTAGGGHCKPKAKRRRGRPRKDPREKKPAPYRQQNPDYYRFNLEKEYNYNLTQEDAAEMQERLLREAAARFRMRGLGNDDDDDGGRGDGSQHYHHGGPACAAVAITEPIFNIAERHPDHWTWRDPYACLGLPPNSSVALVKSQYRRLARVYHPDKSKARDTSSKFHGIARAYRKLTHGGA